MQASETDTRLLRDLLGIRCACGEEKKTRMSHCRVCYYSLSPTQRRALYRKIGSGYAEAYADSILTLQAKGRVPR